jgi:RHS repeat-associated protein
LLVKITAENIFYHNDALGSVIRLTNGSGTIVEQYTYDVYGMPTIKDGSNNPIPISAYGSRFLFTGREFNYDLGIYDYRNRMYSSELGRFMTPDPIGFEGKDYNLYRYVGNNPVNLTDPDGLWARYYWFMRPGWRWSPWWYYPYWKYYRGIFGWPWGWRGWWGWPGWWRPGIIIWTNPWFPGWGWGWGWPWLGWRPGYISIWWGGGWYVPYGGWYVVNRNIGGYYAWGRWYILPRYYWYR